MSKKIPFLYDKLLGLLLEESDFGKTDTGRANRNVCLKYKISKKDLKICIQELKKMNKISITYRKSRKPSIFINQDKL